MKKPKADIKGIASKLNVSVNQLQNIDYPIFCFKYLQENSLENCADVKLLKQFLKRVQKLSELGWTEINKSPRHGFGKELIPVARIKPQLPEFVTPDVTDLHVFRYGGNNLPFVCLKNQKILHVLFIEIKHGDIYDH